MELAVLGRGQRSSPAVRHVLLSQSSSPPVLSRLRRDSKTMTMLPSTMVFFNLHFKAFYSGEMEKM